MYGQLYLLGAEVMMHGGCAGFCGQKGLKMDGDVDGDVVVWSSKGMLVVVRDTICSR